MIAQANFLERSHKEVGIREPLVIVKTNERKKYKKYGCIDDYPIYNRYIAVIEYIKNNNLHNETICLLDCDMFFQNNYSPVSVGDNDIISQMWIGGDGWSNYWKIFQNSEFDKFKQTKNIDLNNPIKVQTPYYMKGNVYLNLFNLALRAESVVRKHTKFWMTEQLCISFCIACLNLKVRYEKLGLVTWFNDNENIDQYPLIHYGNSMMGIKNTEIKKYRMEDSKFMLKEIDNFIKTDQPKTEWDRRVLNFYIKMYGYKGIL